MKESTYTDIGTKLHKQIIKLIRKNEAKYNELLSAAISANKFLANLASEGRLQSENELNEWTKVQQQLSDTIKNCKSSGDL